MARQVLTRHMAFRFDPTGALNGRIEVRIIYTVAPDGNSMEGTGLRYEFDIQDNLMVAPIPITAQATRIVPLPPE